MIRQYGNSPRIMQLMANMDQYLNQDANIEAFYDVIWNIDTAQGFGLDIWGRIVGVSRNVQVANSENKFGFKTGASPETSMPFGQASFYTGAAATQTYALSDDAFRLLILAKAMTNVVVTTAPAINQVLQALFSGRGDCYVSDQGNMQMRYTFGFYLKPYEQAIMQNGGVLPRPTGVSATMATIPTASTFGFQEAGASATFGYGGFENVTLLSTPQIYKTTWNGNDLQYQTARTNMMRQSSFQSSWLVSAGFSSITANASIAPDGSATAALISATAGGSQYIYQSQNFVSGTSYTISAYVKKIDCSTFSIRSFAQAGTASFNLTSGTLTGVSGICTGQSITQLSSGWYRCSATFLASSTASNNCGFDTTVSTFSGNAFYIWGAQCESGAISPLIPTASSAVTVTDYSQSGTSIIFSSAPAQGIPLLWSGSATGAWYNESISAILQQFGTGDGSSTSFTVRQPRFPGYQPGTGTLLSMGAIANVA